MCSSDLHWQSLFNNDFGKCADAFAEAEIQHPHESCHQCNKADNSKGISDKFFFAGPAELFGFSKNFFEISSDAGEKSADFFEKARLLFACLFYFFFDSVLLVPYLDSLWRVCLRQKRQYFLNSSLSGSFFLFLNVL